MAKQAIVGNLLDFCPLRNAFCPLNDPPPPQNSGAATGFDFLKSVIDEAIVDQKITFKFGLKTLLLDTFDKRKFRYLT